MITGKHQHIVPQMMIRQFAGSDGKLVELYKPTLTIGTRRRAPKGILFHDDFYRDVQGDWDGELLLKVENAFKHYYPTLAHGDPWSLTKNGHAGAALVDWIASMFCRTPSYYMTVNALWKERLAGLSTPLEPTLGLTMFLLPKIAFNIMRDIQFTEFQDWFSRPAWRWKFRSTESPSNIVLTDNPICFLRNKNASQPIIVLPMTKNRVLFGGLSEDIAHAFKWSPFEINIHLAARANRSIFAAERSTLEPIVKELKGLGVIDDPTWLELARKPHFGLLDRIANDPIPPTVDTQAFYESTKNAFGASRLKPAG